ncbi:MAG: ABC transporter ATP-binding protein [Candidatus Bruticola sp.]
MDKHEDKMTDSVIKADGITCAYKEGAKVLDNLSLTIKEGEFVGILGPNGAGKSTLLRILAGLLPADSGAAFLYGINCNTMSRRQIAQKLAFVPQTASVWQDFTCQEIVEMGCCARNSIWNNYRSRARTVIQAMQDTATFHLADRYISELSGGEVQRVRIAQALAQSTSVLFLDEPTNHLDVCFQIEIMDLVWRLNRERHLTVVSVLHDLNLAAQYCSRLIVLNKGQIAAEGQPSQVLTQSLISQVFQVQAEITAESPPKIFIRSNINC